MMTSLTKKPRTLMMMMLMVFEGLGEQTMISRGCHRWVPSLFCSWKEIEISSFLLRPLVPFRGLAAAMEASKEPSTMAIWLAPRRCTLPPCACRQLPQP